MWKMNRAGSPLASLAVFRKVHNVSSHSFSSYASCRQGKSDTKLTHVDQEGQAHMVSIISKPATHREALARATVTMKQTTIQLIISNSLKKGDVLGTARIAGIMAAKRTSELIPLCHNINLAKVAVDLKVDAQACRVLVEAKAECLGQTGVEMEALVACSTAALTIYDMVKAVDRGATIDGLCVVKKSGGQSGDWTTD